MMRLATIQAATRVTRARQERLARSAAIAVALVVAVSATANAVTGSTTIATAYPNVGSIVGDYDGETYQICTGILIDEDLFLTAAHCIVVLDDFENVGVSFAETIGPGASRIAAAAMHIHPAWRDHEYDQNDVAVIELASAPSGLTPASLPAAGHLDGIALRGARFTSVGYGMTRTDKTRSFASVDPTNATRLVGSGPFRSLSQGILITSQNLATGDGGTCYGDSGGPVFDAVGTLVGVTHTGDAFCRATNATVRLDRPGARDWVAGFLD